jgi:hypothetical protein
VTSTLHPPFSAKHLRSENLTPTIRISITHMQAKPATIDGTAHTAPSPHTVMVTQHAANSPSQR